MADISKSIGNHIRNFNLSYGESELSGVLQDGYDTIKNTSDVISIYDLIVGFNNKYSQFVEEYKNLASKNRLGMIIDVEGLVSGKNDDGQDVRTLVLRVGKHNLKVSKDSSIIYVRLTEFNGKYYRADYSASTSRKYSDDSGKNKANYRWIPLKPEIIKAYIDLFDKYRDVLYTYERLKKLCVMEDISIILQTSLDGFRNVSTVNVEDLVVSLRFNSDKQDFIRVKVHLDKTPCYDFDGCMATINEVNTPLSQKSCDEILKGLLINTKYLVAGTRNSEEGKKYLKSLISSDNQ